VIYGTPVGASVFFFIRVLSKSTSQIPQSPLYHEYTIHPLGTPTMAGGGFEFFAMETHTRVACVQLVRNFFCPGLATFQGIPLLRLTLPNVLRRAMEVNRVLRVAHRVAAVVDDELGLEVHVREIEVHVE